MLFRGYMIFWKFKSLRFLIQKLLSSVYTIVIDIQIVFVQTSIVKTTHCIEINSYSIIN